MTKNKIGSLPDDNSKAYPFTIQSLTPFSSESSRLAALHSPQFQPEHRSFADLLSLCLSCKLEQSDLSIKEAITLKACSDALNGDPKAREWLERVSGDFQSNQKQEENIVLENLINPEYAQNLPRTSRYDNTSASPDEKTPPPISTESQAQSAEHKKYSRTTTLATDIISALDKPIAPNSEITLREYISRKCIAKLLSGSPHDMKNALKIVSDEEADGLAPITKITTMRFRWARSEEDCRKIEQRGEEMEARKQAAKRRKKFL